MPTIVVPKEAEVEQDYKVMFKDDLKAFPKGVELRSSATLPCSRTLGRITRPPMDAVAHWEGAWKNRKKPKHGDNESFSRRYWDQESMIQGFCGTGDAGKVFGANECDQHPISVSWWWAIEGRCAACARTHANRNNFFQETVAKKLGPRFPEFRLTKTDMADEKLDGTVDIDIGKHPLFRPATPPKSTQKGNTGGRSRSLSEQKKRDKRHDHLCKKYPFYHPRVDICDGNFTYKTVLTRLYSSDISRVMVDPPDWKGWH